MRFDVLIKGGEVVDPASGRYGQFDVAVRGGRIAAVDRAIPAASARRVIDAAGQLVTPGLVDLHTHAYPRVTFWGISPDAVASRTGVTTWVDAGSAGAFTLAGFDELVVRRSRVRVKALVNVSAIGLVARDHELSVLGHCDAGLLERVAGAYPDLVCGVKVRACTPTLGANGLEPVRRAREAAGRLGLPLMTHVSFAPPGIEEVVALLQPGDVVTHCFTGATMRITDDHGRLRGAVADARDRGVTLDVGHGTGSFAWSVAEPLLAAGHPPDTISSDVHQLSLNGPMFDLPTCMSKLLAIGMPLRDVVAAATSRPAELLGLTDAGILRVGAPADVATFALDEGTFRLYDAHLAERTGTRLLRNTRTIVGGRELPPLPLDPPAPWVPLTPAQRAWRDRAAAANPDPPVRHLRHAADFGPPAPTHAPPTA